MLSVLNAILSFYAFNTHRIYITIHHTYMLLYCKGHIQMTSNDRTKNVETKNNRECTK